MEVHEDTPLDFLADQIRAAEAKRRAVEETFMRTPSWRFRRRARLELYAERCREQELEMMGLLWMASKKVNASE